VAMLVSIVGTNIATTIFAQVRHRGTSLIRNAPRSSPFLEIYDIPLHTHAIWPIRIVSESQGSRLQGYLT
jgi:hypothetical protein